MSFVFHEIWWGANSLFLGLPFFLPLVRQCVLQTQSGFVRTNIKNSPKWKCVSVSIKLHFFKSSSRFQLIASDSSHNLLQLVNWFSPIEASKEKFVSQFHVKKKITTSVQRYWFARSNAKLSIIYWFPVLICIEERVPSFWKGEGSSGICRPLQCSQCDCAMQQEWKNCFYTHNNWNVSSVSTLSVSQFLHYNLCMKLPSVV